MSRLRLTIRGRLTALYALLFGASGALLLLASYWLLSRQLDRVLPPNLADETLADVSLQYVLAFLGTLLVAVGLGYAMAARALAPLKRITRTARQVSDERLGERIPIEGPHDELRELSETFNTMLDRLAEAFDGQRRFVANASHELRSPLTLIRSEAEVALANPNADVAELREAAEAVVQASTRTEALLEGLLLLARSQRGLVRQERVDLAEAAHEAADASATEATSAGVSVRVHAEPAEVEGDPALLARLVANLVENAVRYNRREGWVNVRVARRPGDRVALVVVENSGRPVDQEAATRLVEPFQRLAREADRGAGLGLSIVRAVAEAHGGTLRVTPRAEGGLRVEVALPARASGDPALSARGTGRPTGSPA